MDEHTTDADPLGDAIAEVAVTDPVEGEGPWVRVEDARRIAEDAATQAYADITANDD